MTITNRLPAPGLLSAAIVPPCSSTMDLAIARPNPDSVPLRVRDPFRYRSGYERDVQNLFRSLARFLGFTTSSRARTSGSGAGERLQVHDAAQPSTPVWRSGPGSSNSSTVAAAIIDTIKAPASAAGAETSAAETRHGGPLHGSGSARGLCGGRRRLRLGGAFAGRIRARPDTHRHRQRRAAHDRQRRAYAGGYADGRLRSTTWMPRARETSPRSRPWAARCRWPGPRISTAPSMPSR